MIKKVIAGFFGTTAALAFFVWLVTLLPWVDEFVTGMMQITGSGGLVLCGIFVTIAWIQEDK